MLPKGHTSADVSSKSSGDMICARFHTMLAHSLRCDLGIWVPILCSCKVYLLHSYMLNYFFFCGFLRCLAPFSVRNSLLSLPYILLSSFSPPAAELCPFAQEDAGGGSAPIPPQECQRPGAACPEVGLPLQLCLPGAGVAIRLKEDGFLQGQSLLAMICSSCGSPRPQFTSVIIIWVMQPTWLPN